MFSATEKNTGGKLRYRMFKNIIFYANMKVANHEVLLLTGPEFCAWFNWILTPKYGRNTNNTNTGMCDNK